MYLNDKKNNNNELMSVFYYYQLQCCGAGNGVGDYGYNDILQHCNLEYTGTVGGLTTRVI